MVIFIVISLILRKSPQVMLCTECQQCKAVCPLLAQGCNPVAIMLAVKSGRRKEVMEGGAALCISCKKCQRACARGLAPYLEVEKWREQQI